MKKGLIVCSMLMMFVIAAVARADAQLDFLHGPYSGDPTADSVTISWTAAPPFSARVEYAVHHEFVTSGEFSQIAFYTSASHHDLETVHIRLTDLVAGTHYIYRVILTAAGDTDEAPLASRLGTFYTAPSPETEVVFAVLSDTQWRNWDEPNRIELVGNAIAADPTPFQFILHAGDVIEHPFPKYWDHTFAALSEMLLRAPFLPVLGNHERGHRSYYEKFDLPPGAGKHDERWWVFHWGDIVVVGLDSNVTRPSEIDAQTEWIEQQLSGDELHKFVIFHHPLFSSDANYGPGNTGLRILWHRKFAELGVDMVFNGHSHSYERSEQDGVVYVVAGGGGAPNYPLADQRIDGSIVGIENTLHYLRVMTCADAITVEVLLVARVTDDQVVTPETGLLDSFTIPSGN